MKPKGLLTITYTINEEQEVWDEEGNGSIQQVQVMRTTDPELITFTEVR